jgi:hypothetical protein
MLSPKSLGFISSLLVVFLAYAYVISPDLVRQAFSSSVAYLNLSTSSIVEKLYQPAK